MLSCKPFRIYTVARRCFNSLCQLWRDFPGLQHGMGWCLSLNSPDIQKPLSVMRGRLPLKGATGVNFTPC